MLTKGTVRLVTTARWQKDLKGARQVFTQELLEEIFSFSDVSADLGILKGTIDANKAKLNNDAAQWIENFTADFFVAVRTGEKFLGQIHSLLKEEAVIENNKPLQDRISAAAAHFIPLFEEYLRAFKNHPLVTEHKEVSDLINPLLTESLQALLASQYFLTYCRQPFTVTGFLKHKLNLSQPPVSISCYAGNRKIVAGDSPNGELYDTLKRWRDMICEEDGLPVYLVVTHAGLRDICTFLPFTKKDLQQISGFGKAKVDRYGEEILETVTDYCERNSLVTNMAALAGAPKRERKTKSGEPKINSGELSFSLFKAGKSVAEIAKERGLTEGTIETHLIRCIETGALDIKELMTPEKFIRIISIVKGRGEKTISEIKSELPDAGFGEIRMAQAAAKYAESLAIET